MNINDYIVKDINTLTLQDTVKSAKKVCKNYPISHIMIVEKGKLMGCFAERDIRTIENLKSKLCDYSNLILNFHTSEKSTLLELISLFANNDCNLIPVINKNKNYIGYYDLADILDVFASSPFLHRDNESLVIEHSRDEFSMSRICQIVESNKSSILGLYISYESSKTIQITLKIASKNINNIIQTFRRYDYNIITQHLDDQYIEQLKDRSNYFKLYLDI